ncbi:ATP-binding protein [Nonomuraea sp. NPDC050310]|uniref:sensor histidine kinase n=1 Tax=Nonomuraea sp. NPDC050310 TaxID=3154935 RepID=UPI0034059FD2
MAGWSLDRWFRYAAIVGALVILAGSALMVNATMHLSDVRTRIIDVIDPAALKTLDLALVQAGQDASVRSYGLTKEPHHLEVYRQARRDEAAILGELRRLVPEDAPMLDGIAAATDAWRRGYGDLIAAGRPLSTELAKVNTALYAAVRQAVGAERTVLERRHEQARTVIEARAFDQAVALGVLLVVTVALLILLGLVVRRVVLKPITTLAEQVDAVTKGDFEGRIDVARPPELVALSGHIDGMRREILRQWRLAEEQAAELRRSNGDLEQFAYVASHDLQEPLRKVASFTQILDQRYGDQLDDRARQYMHFAVDGAKRMQSLINDLLDFSRVDRMGGEKAPISAELPLRAAVRNLEAQIEESGATVTHDELPEVLGNHTSLTQLFQNLIGNAVKFRSAEPPVVHVSARPAGDGLWEFSCADNGIGVEEKYAERIFLLFQRLHPRDAYHGTGIGLAVCRKIVENHGGTIWVDTSVQEGTTMRWTLRGTSRA